VATASHDVDERSPGAKPREDEQPQQTVKQAAAALEAQRDEAEFTFKDLDFRSAAMTGLLVLAIIAALYLAKTLLMPIVSALVLGTMLSPAASFMQRWRIPRPLAAVLIVIGTFGTFALVIALISAPLLEWTSRLPELAALLKQRAAVLERPLATLSEVASYFGASNGASLQWPKVEWVQPTLEFLSPTFAELLLFFATLVLFIASWPDLRRAVVLMFPDRAVRLRNLRILNAIEDGLGAYLLTVSLINVGVGILAWLVCAISGMPNPVGLGALAATFNFVPIIGPVVTFVVLLAVGVISFSNIATGLLPPLAFAVIAFLEGHFVTPAIIGRRLALNALAVFLSLAFWTWMWGPIGAFLSSPLLIVALVIKQHFVSDHDPAVPEQ
jgi:predicted PurR-regulated permease PerM